MKSLLGLFAAFKALDFISTPAIVAAPAPQADAPLPELWKDLSLSDHSPYLHTTEAAVPIHSHV